VGGHHLSYTLLVSTPLEKSTEVKKYVPECVIKVEKENLMRNLIIISFEDYDLILGIDCCLSIMLELIVRIRWYNLLNPERMSWNLNVTG
jgi:hypothetical protein